MHFISRPVGAASNKYAPEEISVRVSLKAAQRVLSVTEFTEDMSGKAPLMLLSLSNTRLKQFNTASFAKLALSTYAEVLRILNRDKHLGNPQHLV
ncbi:hypothetical protein IRJ41_013374 [Triplophysa rosa]|uniref:Uncharacterized protein n=1 Tax=Triplophysa rosa TaxID=992332 RepID=A0A9W7T501_TRIRA|nr:hypothetical protein IRJ41_013374 [Triplophysa rosa]